MTSLSPASPGLFLCPCGLATNPAPFSRHSGDAIEIILPSTKQHLLNNLQHVTNGPATSELRTKGPRPLLEEEVHAAVSICPQHVASERRSLQASRAIAEVAEISLPEDARP